MQYENYFDQLELDHQSLLSSNSAKLNTEIFLSILERRMDYSLPNSSQHT